MKVDTSTFDVLLVLAAAASRRINFLVAPVPCWLAARSAFILIDNV
jgi:hypothetical protein